MVTPLVQSAVRFFFQSFISDSVVLGIADIMGRRFGSLKLPYNQQKSWAGSISMFVFGFLISIGWVLKPFFQPTSMMVFYLLHKEFWTWHENFPSFCRMVHYFSALGYFQLDWNRTMQKVAIISLVATVVESLPTAKVVDDNISVPLASMVMAFLSFGFWLVMLETLNFFSSLVARLLIAL